MLQTPPFPEYTSGHSVISKASAVVLTKLYGDHFPFEDTTEIKYGLPSRFFDSFHQAADEAAISRLYGGIHYRMAIEQGVVEGEKVGLFLSFNQCLVWRWATMAPNIEWGFKFFYANYCLLFP